MLGEHFVLRRFKNAVKASENDDRQHNEPVLGRAVPVRVILMLWRFQISPRTPIMFCYRRSEPSRRLVRQDESFEDASMAPRLVVTGTKKRDGLPFLVAVPKVQDRILLQPHLTPVQHAPVIPNIVRRPTPSLRAIHQPF